MNIYSQYVILKCKLVAPVGFSSGVVIFLLDARGQGRHWDNNDQKLFKISDQILKYII